jgi:hypothetical protein
MKKVKAIFIGKNGRLGFETKKEYELQLDKDLIGRLNAYAINKGLFCQYGSFMAFLNN